MVKDGILANNRIWQFDFLKLLCSFLVIWGHCLLHYGAPRFSNPICIFIYSFHMPLFMVMCGYFSNLNNSDRIIGGVLIRRFVSYFVPYSTMFLISGILSYIIGIQVDAWFLMSAFCCYIATWMIMKYFKINITTCIILLVLFFFAAPLLSRYKLIYLYPFFIMGIVLRRYWTLLIKHKKIVFITSTIIFLISYFSSWSMESIYDVNSKAWIHRDGVSFYFSELDLYRNLIRYIVGSSACMTILIIPFFIKGNSFVLRVSQYGTFSIEMYLLGLYLDRYHFDFAYMSIFQYTIVCLGVSIIISIICIQLSHEIKKIPIVDFFMFGKGIISKDVSDKLIAKKWN